VDISELRSGRRRVRERLHRLDGVQRPVRAGHAALATAYRYRKIPTGAPAPGEASGDPGRPGHDIADPLSLVRSGLESLSYYWGFLAGMGVLAWIILYLV